VEEKDLVDQEVHQVGLGLVDLEAHRVEKELAKDLARAQARAQARERDHHQVVDRWDLVACQEMELDQDDLLARDPADQTVLELK